ncbi:hypothetical protein OEG92_00425 [Polaribacter sejongensis]|uniref:hypothetical protein n=1 Tax=Polaribacter sejongensis TaxID=985043 RepID=UPI0035A6B0F3
MKSKLTTLSFLIVLLATSYNSFSQNSTNESAEIKDIVSKKEVSIALLGLDIEFNFTTETNQKQDSLWLVLEQNFPEISRN